MVSPAAGLTAIKTIPTIELILIVGMVLYVDNEFYVIQILESFYVEIIIFPVIFGGQTPSAYRSSVECAETCIVGSLLYILECCCYNVSIALQRLPIFLHITSRIFF